MGGRLDGKVALITGGARGQGAAHARRLSEEGARVIAGDVLDADGEATAAKLRADGLAVDYLHLDVTSPTEWARAVGTATERHGGLDVLVNNAGIVHVNPLLSETLEDWNQLLAVNLTGVLLGMQAAIPALRARGGGSIVNISSIFGLAGASGYVAYCASKAAVAGITRTAALEHAADGIRVNAVCPGGVRTAMNENEAGSGVVPLTPMGRRADVREISGTVLYLASDDSTFVTGTEIVVDGGYLAR
jgi:NAD(P)-dependent dehydrogenase (short-subunit alcohol dehydrogenase family)